MTDFHRFVFLLVLISGCSVGSAAELRTGVAAVKITPPVGTPMAGYYHARAADGVHDDLYAKAIVLEISGVKAALVSLDLIATTHALVRASREAIAKATGVPSTNVMISATHAHTGPVVNTEGLRASLLGGGSEDVRRYVDVELPRRITEAVKQAEAGLAPVQASVGSGQESSIAFNRRYHMKDGSVGWNPGVLNLNIVKPAGPIDPQVALLFFETAEKRPVATYVNYSVHLDNVGGQQISADMPAVVARLLSEFKGPEMINVYTSGACGDVNHINVNWAHKQSGFDNAARMGTILAAEVLRMFPKLKPIQPGRLQAATEMVELPLAKIEPADVERAQKVIAQRTDASAKQPTFLETVDAFKVLDVADRQGKPLEVEVQVVALGRDVAWVSLPGEIFVELGLAIKKDSPFPLTIIAELANGSIGYVPTKAAYPQGNYEVISARCAEGSGEMLVEAAARLLQKMHSSE